MKNKGIVGRLKDKIIGWVRIILSGIIIVFTVSLLFKILPKNAQFFNIVDF